MARKVTADKMQYTTCCDDGDTFAGHKVLCVGKFENKVGRYKIIR